MSVGRNMNAAIEAWRALPAASREKVLGDIEHGTSDHDEWYAAVLLLRAAAEPEAKDERPLSDVGAALDAMRTRLADGTVRRHAEEAARKAEPEAKGFVAEMRGLRDELTAAGVTVDAAKLTAEDNHEPWCESQARECNCGAERFR